MSDYIKREDAIKLKDVCTDTYADKKYFIEQLKAIPSADVVEVDRCGHCEWWKCNPNTDKYGVCKKASYDDFEVVMHADDFCSYGKPKEQENAD